MITSLCMEKNDKRVYELNAIKLAYMGDSVFSLYIRRYFIMNTDKKNSQLNKCVNNIVCAKNQAMLMDCIDGLNEKELDIVARARNLHFNNIAKNSTLEQYSKATEFEALLGYWFLIGELDKVENIISMSVEKYYDSGRN